MGIVGLLAWNFYFCSVECGRFVVLIFASLTSLWGVIAAEVDVSLLVAGNGLRPPRRGPNGAASRRLAVLPNQT